MMMTILNKIENGVPMEDDLIIDDSNFDQYFTDVKKAGPKKNQIMARYISKAELISGEEKEYLIDILLTNPMGAEMAVQIAKNAFSAQEGDAIKLCKAIAKDLVDGMSKQQVLDKPYPYTFEKFYWTHEEYVPKDNPHWQAIKITILNDHEKIEEE